MHAYADHKKFAEVFAFANSSLVGMGASRDTLLQRQRLAWPARPARPARLACRSNARVRRVARKGPWAPWQAAAYATGTTCEARTSTHQGGRDHRTYLET